MRHTLARVSDAFQTTRELLLGDDPPTAVFTSQNLITIDASGELPVAVAAA